MLAHIGGLPVEETLLSLGPAGLLGAGAAVVVGRERLRALRVRVRSLGRRVRVR